MERRNGTEYVKPIVPRGCIVRGERSNTAAKRVHGVKGDVRAMRCGSRSRYVVATTTEGWCGEK